MKSLYPALRNVAVCVIFILLHLSVSAQEDLSSDLILSPDSLRMNVGDTTDLILKLDLHGGDNAVDGVEVFIDFDTSAFEVIEIEDIYGFQFELLRDTLGGRIRFAAGILTQEPISADADLLKITVRSKRFVANSGFVVDNDEEGQSSEVAQSGGIPSLANTSPAIVSTLGICFNANGGFYRTVDSTFFLPDGSFVGGIGITDVEEIAETEDDLLFQTAREGEFDYNIALPNGQYRAQFYYSEFNELGESRLMDIKGEGSVLRSEFDIFSQAQAIRTALIDTIFIDVEDDTLNLEFEKATNSLLNPLISAICLDFSDSLLQIVPVELASFSAELFNGNAHLNWESYSEVGFSHYEVQKSLTRNSWTTIGLVNGGDAQYEFIDRAVVPDKVTYYRLKMVDLDGSLEFSDIVSLTRKSSHIDVSIFPNPTSDILNIDVVNEDLSDLTICLINALGQKMILTDTNGGSNLRLDVSNFVPGLYFLQIFKDLEVMLTEQVVIK